MYKRQVIEGAIQLAEELGVKFVSNANVTAINSKENQVSSLTVNNEKIYCDLVVSGADYAHTETLLKNKDRNYSNGYWDKKLLAPSALLFYVGFDKPLDKVIHHTLFFDASFDEHANSIYDDQTWPEKPLFYASFPSKTDDTVAPEGKEAAIFLIPLAPDLEDTEELRGKYFDIILNRLEKHTGQTLKDDILFQRSYCVNDFKEDYNSLRGNAYGLANTLTQTAFLRPKLKSKKLKNLFYTGQLTVPGPGVPPALISGKLVSELITNNFNNEKSI